jgi:hypothetical protein
VVWSIVIAGGSGFLIGFWLRVPAIVAASAATVVACTILLPFANWSLLTAILFGFGLSVALQFGYLTGLLLSCARSQAGSWFNLLRSAVDARRCLSAQAQTQQGRATKWSNQSSRRTTRDEGEARAGFCARSQ